LDFRQTSKNLINPISLVEVTKYRTIIIDRLQGFKLNFFKDKPAPLKAAMQTDGAGPLS
jgi:hypothetical protein